MKYNKCLFCNNIPTLANTGYGSCFHDNGTRFEIIIPRHTKIPSIIGLVLHQGIHSEHVALELNATFDSNVTYHYTIPSIKNRELFNESNSFEPSILINQFNKLSKLIAFI